MDSTTKSEKFFFITGALLAALTIGIGAYGAHAGSKFIEGHEFITFIKGVRYQMFDIVGIFLTSYAISKYPGQVKLLKIAGWLFIAGIILFSGSLYIIVFFNVKMGYITPTGGTAFILGWLILAYAVWKAK